ncbi:MAG: hypothetical protein KDC53_22995, partial [Saprospiraceae bacterium]|nr:hypothetical protein [Saprospiraceae bacterium]
MKFLSTGIFIGFSLLLVISGCKKDDEGLTPQEQFDEDIMIIEDYLQDHNLVAEKTASGLHYIITEEGTGEYPP